MSVKIPPLPGYCGELVRRGYGGAAVRLIMEWGGQKRYIPKYPTSDCPLVQVVGMEAAQILAELTYRSGLREYDVPPRSWLAGSAFKDQILREEGSTREIAAKLGCSERHVRDVRAAAGRPAGRKRAVDTRQINMFEYLTEK